MEDDNISKTKFKDTINELFTYEKKYRTHTRAELMKQIKNLILSNENLNHREIHFNYKHEYREMNKTMKKFNRNSDENKKIITELTKENDFFSKSYSNMISLMINKLENKNINYQTIINFNEKYMNKYMNKYNKDKQKNFFFQEPLLLTKRKDMKYFYLYQNETDEEKDQFLNYSTKILNKINKQFPILKINNIIKEYNNKTNYRFNIAQKSSKRNFRFNTFYGQKSLAKKIFKDNLNNKNILKINKNFFDEKNEELNNKYKPNEIKIIKKKSQNYDTKIKMDINNQEKSKSHKNSNLLIERTRNIKYKTTRNNDLQINPLTERNIMKSSNKKLFDKLLKFGLDNKEINNIKEKINKYEKKKISKIKGSIQIENIYDDYIKTKKIIDVYKKSNINKLKYLYYSSGKKNMKTFNKNERENNRINNLGYNLFWAINK